MKQNSAFFPCTEPLLKALKVLATLPGYYSAQPPFQASPGPTQPPPASMASWGYTINSSPAKPGALFRHKNPKVATQGEEEFKFKLPTRQYRDLPLSHRSCLRISLWYLLKTTFLPDKAEKCSAHMKFNSLFKLSIFSLLFLTEIKRHVFPAKGFSARRCNSDGSSFFGSGYILASDA